MASGRLIDYLGQGDLADRPATPDLAPGGLGFYYATDESTLYVYSDNGWEVVVSAASWVSTIVPGTGILVDDSDPENPEVSVDVTSLGFIESVVAGEGVSVDDTDPLNPIIEVDTSSFPTDNVSTPSVSAGTVTLDLDSGRVKNFSVSLTDDATLAVSNLAGAGIASEFECLFTQDATGSRTLTLPSSFKALGGSATSVATAANSKTLLSAKTFDNGITWAYAMQELA